MFDPRDQFIDNGNLKPFDGIGLRQWIKLVFMTRAATIRQCDAITRQLFEENQRLNEQLNGAKYYQGRLAQQVTVAGEALEAAQVEMFNAGWCASEQTTIGRLRAYNLVVVAMLSGMEPL